MDKLNIRDEEYVSFLRGLGVETCMRSFEWMNDDPDISFILRFLYTNLDANNALNAREEYRYVEIEKKGQLLPQEELKAEVNKLQEEYENICLPGNLQDIEDVKMDISFLKERLSLLSRQEAELISLHPQNDLTNEELNLEQTRLNSVILQCAEDTTSLSNHCLALAEEKEAITDETVDIITTRLDMYKNSKTNPDIAKKLFTFGPFDSYRQMQTLFRSDFDLYVSRKLVKKQDIHNIRDWNMALIEARNMEERLINAVCSNIESRVDLQGEQAKLELIMNYTSVHPSLIPKQLIELHGQSELLVHEEEVIEQQLEDDIKKFVEDQIQAMFEVAKAVTFAVREQMLSDVTYLWEICGQALALDRILYYAVRQEVQTLQEILQFASHFRQHIIDERDAVYNRIVSMYELSREHADCEKRLQSSETNCLIKSMCSILGADLQKHTSDASELIETLEDKIKRANNSYFEEFLKREKYLDQFVASTEELRNAVWDGSTRKPNARNRCVAALTHKLTSHLQDVDQKVKSVSCKLYENVKNEKNISRKLWQWFLTDKEKFLTAVMNINENDIFVP